MNLFCEKNNCIAVKDLDIEYPHQCVNFSGVDYFYKFIGIKFIKKSDIEKVKRVEQKVVDNINSQGSYGELDLYNFISSIYEGEIIKRTRKIIPPLELDFYLPDIKLAIEYNSNYYHSKEHGIPDDYHIQKSIKCKEKDVRLIHIFEFEDMEEQLNLLLNFLSGVDEYGNNFNKNNFLDTYTNGIIYKDKRHTIYGAL